VITDHGVPGHTGGDHGNRRAIEATQEPSARSTGRRYRSRLELLDAAGLVELERLLRELDEQKGAEVRQAREAGWRP